MNETKRILVDFAGDHIAWTDVVEMISSTEAIVTWDQPGAGQVTGYAHRMGDTHPETGETVWTWNGCFDTVS